MTSGEAAAAAAKHSRLDLPLPLADVYTCVVHLPFLTCTLPVIAVQVQLSDCSVHLQSVLLQEASQSGLIRRICLAPQRLRGEIRWLFWARKDWSNMDIAGDWPTKQLAAGTL